MHVVRDVLSVVRRSPGPRSIHKNYL